MRQSQPNRRGRGRGRKAQNPLTRNYESNGPDVKIRGTAAHISEKYLSLARDALASGDIVRHENYLQHGEHYNRIIMAAQQANNEAGEASAAQAGDNEEEQRADANGTGNGAKQKKNQRRRRDGKKADRGQKNQPEAQANGQGEHAANGKGDSSEADREGGAKVGVAAKDNDARGHAASADDAAA